jgi:trimethylamine:corrinoid methyltransferase-like protein
VKDPSESVNVFRNSQFPNLTEKKCRRIHEASLEILERVGARLFLDRAVDLLKKAGSCRKSFKNRAETGCPI